MLYAGIDKKNPAYVLSGMSKHSFFLFRKSAKPLDFAGSFPGYSVFSYFKDTIWNQFTTGSQLVLHRL